MDVAVVAGGLGLTKVEAMLGGVLAQADGWTERCTTGTSSGDYPPILAIMNNMSRKTSLQGRHTFQMSSNFSSSPRNLPRQIRR